LTSSPGNKPTVMQNSISSMWLRPSPIFILPTHGGLARLRWHVDSI